jgi:hypothetical protein
MQPPSSGHGIIVVALRITQVAGFSAGFLAFARLAVPFRAALALAMTPAVDKYFIQPLAEKGFIKGGSGGEGGAEQ